MINSILSAHDTDTVQLRGNLFIAQLAYDYRTSQSAIIAALRPCITPSQPEATSKPHAPAAQTDGEGSPPCASPSVEPVPEAPKPLPDASDIPADALVQPAEAKTSEQEDGGAVSAVKGANARLENAKGVEPPPSNSSMVHRLRALFADGNQPTNKEAMEALGLKGAGATANLAKRAGVTFRKLTKEEFAAKVAGGMQRKAEAQKAKVAERAESLRASLPSERLRPLPENDVSDVLHRPRKAPTGRFYLREKGSIGQPIRYVHQSLQPSPSGPGPMMTTDRKWAWFDNIERYRGALAKWPQITSMIKEAANG